MQWNIKHPGTVGISYENANAFLNALEDSGSELHGLLVLRHGQPVMEGYWAPYGPGVGHGCQSLTKTLSGIALGAALQEGILSLDDRLIDLFPEFAHHAEGRPWWDELRVRHIATMGAGMESQPPVISPTWIEEFFQMDIVHQPGTAFFYNSVACSMVGVCIRKKTGLGLIDYLTPRIFDKLGVDVRHIGWHCHPDGQENGSGGLISTARNNALLMELYRRDGVWNGERLLQKEWVDFALQVENPYAPGAEKYGGMLWVWRDGCFVADGAMGQWGMLFQKEDVVIVLHQTISSQEEDRAVRRALFHFVDALQETEVAWTPEETRRFERRLRTMAIPAPVCQENPAALRRLDGRMLKIVSGTARFFADDLAIFNEEYLTPVESFAFAEEQEDLRLTVTARGQTRDCLVSLKGCRPVCNVAPVSINPARIVSVSGSFQDEQTLVLEIRWLESCRVHEVTFHFTNGGAEITTRRLSVGGFDVPDEHATAVWTA